MIYQENNLKTLSSKEDLKNFVNVHLITHIFNNSVNDYPKRYQPNEHFLSEFNKFMGMRMTFNRVTLQENTDRGYEQAIPFYRENNYKGRTNKGYDHLETGPYPPTGTKYSK